MQKIRDFLGTPLGDYFKTILVCTLVAIFINVIEGNTKYAWLTFFCSYCYGLCIHTCINLSQRLFPQKGKLVHYIIPAVLGFVVSTFLIVFSTRWFLADVQSDVTGWLLVAFIASSLTLYWYFIVEREAQMKTELKTIQLEKAEKEKLLLQSQLKLLQSQIEPHFLFNTIANLKASIQLEPKRAMLMLDHLSVLLRHSLKRSKDNDLTIQDELSFCDSYLAIQKVRLGERLDYELKIEDDVDLTQILPPLLIQPLVENAILHGIEPSSTKCKLSILLSVYNREFLKIEIFDNGVGLGNSDRQGYGVGLGNVRQRSKHYYGEKARLDIKSNEQGGVTAILFLPTRSGKLLMSSAA
ncbi:MAG: histidine kinase [Kangiellaceae bacterium]|nr:histidine kinase [Kangiellaceae bacterium]